MDQLTSLPPLVAVLAVSGAVVVGAMTLKVRKDRSALRGRQATNRLDSHTLTLLSMLVRLLRIDLCLPTYLPT